MIKSQELLSGAGEEQFQNTKQGEAMKKKNLIPTRLSKEIRAVYKKHGFTTREATSAIFALTNALRRLDARIELFEHKVEEVPA
jgi:hypothetical protein